MIKEGNQENATICVTLLEIIHLYFINVNVFAIKKQYIRIWRIN